MLRFFAGGGSDFSEDAGLDTVNLGSSTAAFAEGPQGVFYLEKEARVRLLKPDGGVSTVAGDLNFGFAGDGLPATEGRFNYARLLEVDPQGNFYIADIENYRIRRVDAVTGLLSTVVGNGQRGYSPDGTLATDAKLDGLSDMLFGHDGHLYFMAQAATGMTLRRVENGALTTVAGGSLENYPPWESESPKGIAFRSGPHWLAQGVDGTLYVAGYDSGAARSDYVVRSIGADGRVKLLAGAGTSLDPYEPEARNTCFSGLTGLAVAHDGTLYVGESGGTGCGLRGPGVRAISPDGAFSLFLGGVSAATSGYQPPDGAAALTQLNGVGEVILRTNGSLLFMHRGPTATVHEVALPRNANRLVPSQDGEEVYAFDARGRHLRTVSARTGLLLLRFAWGTDGLGSVTDVNGDVTRVERRADGTAAALVSHDGQRTELTLNAAGQVERVTDAMGRFVEAAYFPTGLLSEWKDENGQATAFTWDEVGNLSTHTNTRSAKQTYTPVLGGVGFTSPEGRLTQYLTESGGGGTAQTTSWPDGSQATRVSGPGFRRALQADGTSTTVEMQAGAGNRFGRAVDVPGKVVVRTPLGLEQLVTTTRTTTTAPGDALQVTSETEISTINGRAWTSRYDAAARTYSWTSPLGRASSMTVDDRQRPLVSTSPGVLPVAFGWDARGRLESVTQGPRVQRLTYGPNGFLATSRNAADEVTTFTTDATGRVLKTTRPDMRDITIEEDAVGNLVSVTPPGGEPHRYGYTSANEVASYAQPPLPGIVPETVTSDLDGLSVSGTHTDGTSTAVTREPLTGRVTRVTTPWWTSDVTYVPVTGQVASLTRGTQRLEWKYDGFLVTEEKATGIAPATNQWSYDVDFRVATHTVNGASVVFGYDADSLLTQAGPVTLVRDGASGRMASVTTGVVTTTFSYTPYGELQSLVATVSGVPVYSEGLSYDLAGRISVIEDIIQGATTQWTYGYDALGQLTSVTRNGMSTISWGYDARGNRTSSAGVAATYDAQDKLLTRGAASYGWDALGGRTSKTEAGLTTQYVHDGMGALLSVVLPDSSTVAYEYDGLQRRVARRRNGTVVARLVYDSQSRVVAEVDASGAVTSRFVYAAESSSPDALVRAGATLAYVKNHLGSIRLVVDSASGVIIQRLDYDAWGVVAQDSAPGAQPFGFAGGVMDADTGSSRVFTHFGYRDYDAASGVWTAMDPIRLRVGAGYLSPEPYLQDPQWVREQAKEGFPTPAYSYARNNPLRYTDPTGLAPPEYSKRSCSSEREREIAELIQSMLPGDYCRQCDLANANVVDSCEIFGKGRTSGLTNPNDCNCHVRIMWNVCELAEGSGKCPKSPLRCFKQE